MSAAGIRIGGTARVYCVHDREKRRVADLPDRERPRFCACCENLFADPVGDQLLCGACRRPGYYRSEVAG